MSSSSHRSSCGITGSRPWPWGFTASSTPTAPTTSASSRLEPYSRRSPSSCSSSTSSASSSVVSPPVASREEPRPPPPGCPPRRVSPMGQDGASFARGPPVPRPTPEWARARRLERPVHQRPQAPHQWYGGDLAGIAEHPGVAEHLHHVAARLWSYLLRRPTVRCQVLPTMRRSARSFGISAPIRFSINRGCTLRCTGANRGSVPGDIPAAASLCGRASTSGETRSSPPDHRPVLSRAGDSVSAAARSL